MTRERKGEKTSHASTLSWGACIHLDFLLAASLLELKFHALTR